MREARKEMPEIKTGKIEQACARYGLGRNTVENVKSEIEKLKCSEVQLMKKAWDLEQKERSDERTANMD